jgi:hypothetical protein
MSIKERGLRAINLQDFNSENIPEIAGYAKLKTPKERQYILRCLLKKPFGAYYLPIELEWLQPILLQAIHYQENVLGIRHGFCYVTVRSGEVDSTDDDVWHVDGFSTSITHLPEQNYIWTDVEPTEYYEQAIDFPKDFDPLIHNVHSYINDYTKPLKIKTLIEETLYCMDPYVIHRRPPLTKGIQRTFVRISFTPIEIDDVNNTQNPLLKREYTRDGVKDVRNKLKNYVK